VSDIAIHADLLTLDQTRWDVLSPTFNMSIRKETATAIAKALLAGELEAAAMTDRAGELFAKRWRWLAPMARRVEAAFRGKPRPRTIALANFLLDDAGFSRAYARDQTRIANPLAVIPTMRPIASAEVWSVPSIGAVGDLADWLGLSASELDWFADVKQFESKRSRGKLRNYHYRPVAKRFGQIRLIEASKPRLKAIQKKILGEILNKVPSHSAAHGFRVGRSIRTFAAPHVDKEVVAKIDLCDFFPSIAIARVRAIFRSLGYPDQVADLLTGLCSNTTPPDAWDNDDLATLGEMLRNAQRLYEKPHLPQGAPTSPALANLCAYRLDCRLSALAESAGATYTRYADDLAFSGDAEFAKGVKRFLTHVCATVAEEGFRVHHRKTRVMRRGVRQRVAGLVVNQRLNVARDDFDRLKAILTNCVRLGASSQNRDGQADYRAHLQGRVAYVESINSLKGAKLRRLFRQIEW
jgi:RNA-directed DNA polymerase